MGSSDQTNELASPGQGPNAGAGRYHWRQDDGGPLTIEEAEPLHVGRPEGQRLADDGRAGLGLVDLQTDGEIAGEQAKADRDPIRMEAGSDQGIEIVGGYGA